MMAGVISRDVKFVEDEEIENAGTGEVLKSSNMLSDTEFENLSDDERREKRLPNSELVENPIQQSTNDVECTEAEYEEEEIDEVNSEEESTSEEVRETVKHLPVTRRAMGIVKPNTRYALTITPTKKAILTSIKAALQDPDWRNAMRLEFEALIRN